MFWTIKNAFFLKESCTNIFEKKLTQKLQSQKILTLGHGQLLSIDEFRLLVDSIVFPIYDLLMLMLYSMI
jgi:hypothetical protein